MTVEQNEIVYVSSNKPMAQRALVLAWCGAALLILGLFSGFFAPIRAVLLLGAALLLAAACGPAWAYARTKQNPKTGLRLDQNQISGDVLPMPLSWRSIARFGVIKTALGPSIGISMRQPERLGSYKQDMLQPDDPAESWAYHLNLNTQHLDGNYREILSQLRTWHAKNSADA
ncbi:MAG: hypothetical protein AB8B71_02460 [Paracoccaceae bacterium]